MNAQDFDNKIRRRSLNLFFCQRNLVSDIISILVYILEKIYWLAD